ncbi:MAG: PD40 domain-containing protein [Deltaproteobacteria bacterium]|nr:PD40 domain-containing protein [Deltaproteobacteria bacterium]
MAKKRDFPLWAAGGLLLLAPFFWAAVPSGQGGEPLRERILYTSFRPSGWGLYLFDGPGRPPRLLTDPTGLDYDPVISPDGQWVVFCSERRGNPHLYLLDLNHPGPARLLTDSDAMESAPSFSPDGRRLAFVSTRDGNADIFILPFQPDGPGAAARAQNLTRHPGGDFRPAFSPDGKKIAFSSDRDGNRKSDLYMMDADGSQVQRLTRLPGWNGSPAWSRDGRWIYFYSRQADDSGLWRMKADGSDLQRIFSGPALSPAVSPQGRVAFAGLQNDRWQIFSIAPDGSAKRLESDGQHEYWAPAFDPVSSRLICYGTTGQPQASPIQTPAAPFPAGRYGQVRLPDRLLELRPLRGSFPSTDAQGSRVAFSEHFRRISSSRLDGSEYRVVFDPHPESAWRPNWSQDGKWIVCTVGPTFGRPAARADIWKFRPDGSQARNLTGGSAGNNAFPYFSPDGRWIVFRSGRTGRHEIFRMNADGTYVRPLTDFKATATMPAFSPEGKQIAFTSNHEGDYEIYTLDLAPDGNPGRLRRLTDSPGIDAHPVYSPDSQWLVFTSQRGGRNDEDPLYPFFHPQPYGEIHALRLADGLVVRLTHNKWEDGTPTWAPIPR